MKILFVLDDFNKLYPNIDTSLLLISGLLKKKAQIDICLKTSLATHLKKKIHSETTPVYSVIHSNFFEYPKLTHEPRFVNVNHYDHVFHRLEPPTDPDFILVCDFMKKFNQPEHINDPGALTRLKEHLLQLDYQDHAIPTYPVETSEEVRDYIQKYENVVLKPIDSYGGKGILFLSHESISENEKITQSLPALIQPYQHEIDRSGDLRVIVYKGHYIGGLLRIPTKPFQVANISQGASSKPLTPSQEIINISETIGKDLMKKKVPFVGFDFIGNKISEINITSPSCLAILCRDKPEENYLEKLLSLI